MDEPGLTPLHKAALQGDTATIAALRDAGADPNAMAKGRGTPLHEAASGGHPEAIAALRDAGADPNARAKCRRTPLHEAASWGHPKAIAALRDAGADLNARTWFGWTPMHKAAGHGQPAAITALRDAGADPNARTWFGRTPLYFAAAAGHTAAVAALRAERVGSTKPDHLSGRARRAGASGPGARAAAGPRPAQPRGAGHMTQYKRQKQAVIVEWWGPYTLSAARENNSWEDHESPVFVLYMALGNGKVRYITCKEWSERRADNFPHDPHLSDRGNQSFYLGWVCSGDPRETWETAQWTLIRALRPELNEAPARCPPEWNDDQYCGSVCSWFYSLDGMEKREPPLGFPTVITFHAPMYDDPPDEERVLRLRLDGCE